MEDYWIKWDDLFIKLHNEKKRKLVFFGRSEDWVPKALRKLKRFNPVICDSNVKYNKTYFHNINVFHKSKFFKDKNKYFFIITTGSYNSVIKDFKKNNILAGKDFVCLPDFYDFAFLDNLRKKRGLIIVSSSDQVEKRATRYSAFGGGIFSLEFNETNCNIQKKLKGSFRQICKINKSLYAAAEYSGAIFVFDKKFKIKKKIKLSVMNMCGISYSKDKNLFVVTSQTEDKFYLVCNKKDKVVDEIQFSNLSGSNKSLHHLNDVLLIDNKIYFTFFSASGNWKNGIFDGGIGEVSLKNKQISIISNNAIQPHTPRIINGSIAYCDSSNAKVIMGGQSKDLEFNGFTRGLYEKNDYVFVGQSETMYLTRLQRLNKTIDITSGIFMVDINSNCRRFLPTSGICNIHDFVVEDIS